MNYRKLSNVAAIGRLLLLLMLACFPMQQAAQAQVKKVPGGQTEKPAGPPACTEKEKAEVTAFSLNPTVARQGQSVKATMTIENKCPGGTAVLSVPWKIYLDSQMIKTGTAKISAGSKADVTTSWTAVVGEHHFYGSAFKSTLPDVIINVPRVSSDAVGDNSGQPAQLETQVLNYQKAKAVGAQFSDGIEGTTTCGPIGQYDPAVWIYPDQTDKTIAFVIACVAFLGGGKADPEAFKNFTLKNGWRIKSIDQPTVVYDDQNILLIGHGNWQWVIPPRRGSDNPYMQMHLVATYNQVVSVFVKVIIEGPAGTDPYQ